MLTIWLPIDENIALDERSFIRHDYALPWLATTNSSVFPNSVAQVREPFQEQETDSMMYALVESGEPFIARTKAIDVSLSSGQCHAKSRSTHYAYPLLARIHLF